MNKLIEIIKNKYLAGIVFGYLNVNSAGWLKYYDCVSLEWMIKQQYYGLIKYRLERNDYLLVDGKTIYFIFRITDIEVFKLVYHRYQYYFTSLSSLIPIIKVAIEYKNIQSIEYFFQQQQPFIDFPQAFQLAFQANSHKLVNLLIGRSAFSSTLEEKDVILLISEAIKTGNKEIVGEFLNSPFSPTTLSDKVKESFYILAYDSGDIELFKFVYQRYNSANGQQQQLGNLGKHIQKSIDGQKLLLQRNLRFSFELLMYCKEQLKVIDPKTFDGFRDTLALVAFKQQDMDLFMRFKKPNTSLSLLVLYGIKDAFSSLENVKKLVQLGVNISVTCIATAAESDETWDIFVYLFDLYKRKEALISGLLSVSCQKSNIKLLNFILPYKSSITLQSSWIIGRVAKANNLEFLKFYLQHFPVQSGYILLGEIISSVEYCSLDVFSHLFSLLPSHHTSHPVSTTPFYIETLRCNKNDILEFLISKKVPYNTNIIDKANSKQSIELLLEAGHSFAQLTEPTFAALEYFIEHILPTSNRHNFSLEPFILLTIQHHKIEYFKLLLDYFIEVSEGSIEEQLGRIGNIEMLQYFYDNYTADNIYSHKCFKSAMGNNNLDVIKFLVDRLGAQYFKPILYENKVSFKMNLELCQPFIREYFKIVFGDPDIKK
ncbi:hypothetical protein CYY_004008 [Polysphondylium violaceum]|uniref:Ankyrin repeat-containing protein n=1 Tax=Polysphondylium violaceum TaxID=133409 RepID=A0A8J4PYW3_9MYCE|nr:hypothetical protein CYY_004008 [Polysphondylium violaceum]